MNLAWVLLFTTGYGAYFGRDNSVILRLSLLYFIVETILYISWSYVFPELTGEKSIITPLDKTCKILCIYMYMYIQHSNNNF